MLERWKQKCCFHLRVKVWQGIYYCSALVFAGLSHPIWGSWVFRLHPLLRYLGTVLSSYFRVTLRMLCACIPLFCSLDFEMQLSSCKRFRNRKRITRFAHYSHFQSLALTEGIAINILLLQMCRQVDAERKDLNHKPNIVYVFDGYNTIHSAEFSVRNSSTEYPCRMNNSWGDWTKVNSSLTVMKPNV